MIPFYVVASISVVLYAIVVNFFRCPIRIFDGETKNIAVAAADGKVVVIEEVDENAAPSLEQKIATGFMPSRELAAVCTAVASVVAEMATSMMIAGASTFFSHLAWPSMETLPG